MAGQKLPFSHERKDSAASSGTGLEPLPEMVITENGGRLECDGHRLVDTKNPDIKSEGASSSSMGDRLDEVAFSRRDHFDPQSDAVLRVEIMTPNQLKVSAIVRSGKEGEV